MKGESQPSTLDDIRCIQPVTTFHMAVPQVSVASSKPKIELDSHVATGAVSDDCLVIHDPNKKVNVYSYNPQYGHK